MKKLFSTILIVASLFAFSVKGHSQTTLAQTDPAGATSTVNTNVDTSYHTIDLAGQTNNFSFLNFSIKGTKTSGTVGGAVTLWGSSDNSKWFAVYGASTAAMSDTVTTQSLANSDNDLQFLVDKTRYRYYRVRVITSGTQVSAYTVKMLGRKVAN